MALEYVLGNFGTGDITLRNLPVLKGTDKVTLTIAGGTAELEVDISKIKSQGQRAIESIFKCNARFIALIDTTAKTVLFAGFINKRVIEMGRGYVRVQLAGVEEYLKARYVVFDGGKIITDPTAGVTFTAGSNAGLMGAVVRRAFDATMIPAGRPVPPAILGTTPTDNGSTFKKEVIFTEGRTFSEVLEEISEESQVGFEGYFKPEINENLTKIKWNFVAGNSTTPHINENKVVNITLNDSSKISSYSTTVDSRDIFNTLFIQTKDGEETAGADLQAKSKNSDTEIPLFEAWFNPNVELTQAQIDEQAKGRLETSLKNGLELNFSVEEQWDKRLWISNLGATVKISGVPSTISEEENRTVRAVSVSLSVQKSTISVEFMPILPAYPRLPGQKKKDNAFGNDKRDPNLGRGTGNITPPTPEIPTPEIPDTPSFETNPFNPSPTPGEFSELDMWGDEGMGRNKKVKSVKLEDFRWISEPGLEDTGFYTMLPSTVVQNEKNRIFGLDKQAELAHIRFSNGERLEGMVGRNGQENYLNTETWAPIQGWEPIHIRTAYLVDGKINGLTNAGTITHQMLEEWVGLPGIEQSKITPGFLAYSGLLYSIWTGGGRVYFGLVRNSRHYPYAPGSSGWQSLGEGMYWRSSGVIYSSAYDPASGVLDGNWRKEPIPADMYSIPYGPSVSRIGDNFVVFTAIPCAFMEYRGGTLSSPSGGMSEEELFNEWITNNQERTGYYPINPVHCPPFADVIPGVHQQERWSEDGKSLLYYAGSSVSIGNSSDVYGGGAVTTANTPGYGGNYTWNFTQRPPKWYKVPGAYQDRNNFNSFGGLGVSTEGYVHVSRVGGQPQPFEKDTEPTGEPWYLARVRSVPGGQVPPDAIWQGTLSKTDVPARTEGSYPESPAIEALGISSGAIFASINTGSAYPEYLLMAGVADENGEVEHWKKMKWNEGIPNRFTFGGNGSLYTASRHSSIVSHTAGGYGRAENMGQARLFSYNGYLYSLAHHIHVQSPATSGPVDQWAEVTGEVVFPNFIYSSCKVSEANDEVDGMPEMPEMPEMP